MNKKNLENNVEIKTTLNSIKIALYLIIALLLINVVVNCINTKNTWSMRKYNSSSESGNEQGNQHGDEPIEDNSNYESDIVNFKEVDYAGLKKLMKDKGTHVIYIGRSSCGYCAMFLPIMIEAQEKYDFKTYYFDITRVFNFTNNSIVDKDAYNELSEYNNFFKDNFLATPMVVIFKDGKFVDGSLGYKDVNAYSSFLEKNNFKKK